MFDLAQGLMGLSACAALLFANVLNAEEPTDSRGWLGLGVRAFQRGQYFVRQRLDDAQHLYEKRAGLDSLDVSPRSMGWHTSAYLQRHPVQERAAVSLGMSLEDPAATPAFSAIP